MKLVKLEELIPELVAELKSKGLAPVVMAREDGTKQIGYIIDDEGLFWGVKTTTSNESKS